MKDKYIFLFEAQSTWSENLTLKIFLYLGESFRRYINSDDHYSVHNEKRIHLPMPELYVIYSGPGKKPDVISFSEDYFGGNPDIELKVHVLSEANNTTLSGQYIGFCKVFDEQRKLYDDGITAAKEKYRICIEKGYLTEFMKAHEQEVIDMMHELFDEETARKQYDTARSIQDIEKGEAKGRAEEKIAVAINMLAKGKLSIEEIAEYSGLALDRIKELASGTAS